MNVLENRKMVESLHKGGKSLSEILLSLNKQIFHVR